MANFKGKAIYQPAGKAAEYAKWACNFYVGCSNGCEYCYLKKGRGAAILGGDKPMLKKCFKDENDAILIFKKELEANIKELKKHGLFFSFTTDPMLFNTAKLTAKAVSICLFYDIPVKILTKSAKFTQFNWFFGYLPHLSGHMKSLIAFGFTLTGHDELEPGASTNQERIEAMKKLHEAGFKTFASIEPIVDFKSSMQMIYEISGYCNLIKIGLESGRIYNKEDLLSFIRLCNLMFPHQAKEGCIILNIYYFKDSFLKAAGIERSELTSNCVNHDYDLFCRHPVWQSCEQKIKELEEKINNQ